MNSNWKNHFKKIGVLAYISKDDNQHNIAHIHFDYGEYSIVISLIDLSVVVGNMPTSKLTKILKILKSKPELVKLLLDLFYDYNPRLKK